MKTANKTLVVIILLFTTAWTCFSQSNVQVKTYNGLTTTTFLTSFGTVQVYLPNISGSQTISGTVKTLPKGDSKRKQEKNLKALQKLKLNIGDASINLQSHQFTIPSCAKRIDLRLNNNSNQTTTINLNETINICDSTCVPSYIVAGSPAPISSSLLDGNITNTSIVLGSTKTNILAESENHVFFEVPNNLSGEENLTFTEADTTIQDTVNVLQLNLSVEKLSLLRSETTTLTILVSGLEGLTENVPLTLTNTSTENIKLQNGNSQNINITTENNTFSITESITAIISGSYSITASIIPDELENNNPDETLLCNCWIDDYSYFINPEACIELGGHCNTEIDNNTLFSDSDSSRRNIDQIGWFSFNNTTNDISDLEDEVEDNNNAYEKAKKRKEEAEDNYNDLVTIDKVLDSVPKSYDHRFKKIIDSLLKVQKNIPKNVNSATLQKAVDDAQKRVDACKKRIKDLEEQEQKLKEQLETDKDQLIKTLEALKNILEDYNIELKYEFNEDGTLSISEDTSGMFEYDKEKIKSEGDFIDGLRDELRSKRKQYNKTLKKQKDLPNQIEDAKDNCDALTEALDKAKEAKVNSDLASAIESELEALCEEIKSILGKLWHWCANNPDYCTTSDVDKIRAQCPKTLEELKDFWEDYDALIKKKKAIEDDFGKKVKNAENEMEDLDQEYDDLKSRISALEEAQRKKHQEELERKQKKAQAEAKAAADKKATADKRKKKRDKQKKEDKEVEDFLKKIKSDDAGNDAVKKLLIKTGLDTLDELKDFTKKIPIGTMIGGLLTAKDVPDCTCPIIKALRDAISARNRKENSTISSYVDAYLIEWNKCASLPAVSSVPVGSTELTKAIKGMTDAQTKKALEALNQAVRVQCK